MTAVLNLARDEEEADVPNGARRCLVSGEIKPREALIRFVIGPEHDVVPDLSENLPGRGLWVTASPEAIGTAVKKNLFAKAAKTTAHPAADLADSVLRLMRKRCLHWLGLAKGAGVTVLGETQTESALRAGKLALLLCAEDAARALDNRHAIAECRVFTRDELGAALGYELIVYAGLAPHGLTDRLKLDLARLQSLEPAGRNEG